jgi:hypothetical protein
MPKIIAAIAISLIAGFAAGAWLMGDEPTRDVQYPDSPAPTDGRLLRLEQMIAEERDARIMLESQLQFLIEEIERIDAAGPRMFSDQANRVEETRAERRNAERPPRDFASMMRGFQDRRLSSLIDGGFSEDEARRIMRKESEAEFKAMQAAYVARRNGETVDSLSAMNEPQSVLRAELGDSDYERYLRAQGQPTAIQVTRVLDSSPGSQAGLQPGDQIVSYNGERVFNVNDLRELTLQGSAGENVILEIERDGVPMQLNVPRGPVGITGSGASIRNMNRWGGS